MATVKVMLTLDKETVKIVDSIHALGSKRSQKIRGIIINWLLENKYIKA